MSGAQKRRKLTLEDKKKIIDRAAENVSRVELAKRFGVPRTTIIGILNARDSIEKAIECGDSTKRSRIKPTRHDELEKAILTWFKQVRSQNVPVTGQLLQEKAKQLANELKIEGFHASNGWLEKFTRRHSITFKSVQGEAGAVNMFVLNDWQQEILKATIDEFLPDDVYNVDETGLFWRLLPNKTLAFKGEQCTTGKKSKDRITVLIGANMTGSEKLPLLVIGKSAKPRCFKNAKIPVDYKANSKAWMTAAMFETWLKEWDKKLEKDGRKILLYVDNCTAHSPRIQLKCITLKFLPPNTTAESQPMDQGVIQNLKVHYRRLLLRKRIDAIDVGYAFSLNLLDAIHLLRRAWEAVSDNTIQGCFRRAKFTSSGEVTAAPHVNEELAGLWHDLAEEGELEEGVSLDDYVTVDQQLQTDGMMTVEEIAASAIEAVEDDPEEIETKEPELPPVTNREARKALDVLRRYIEKSVDDPAVLALCDKLDDVTAKQRIKAMKQKKLTDYLS